MSARGYSDLIASLRDMARRTYVHDDLSVNDYEDAAAAIEHLQRDAERLRAMTAGIEEIASALRLAIADKRAFAVCVEGRNGSTFTIHNCDDATICARMLERFARQQRGSQ